MRDAMPAIEGSLSIVSKIFLEKQRINPERIYGLLDAREFHVALIGRKSESPPWYLI